MGGAWVILKLLPSQLGPGLGGLTWPGRLLGLGGPSTQRPQHAGISLADFLHGGRGHILRERQTDSRGQGQAPSFLTGEVPGPWGLL